MVDNAYVWWVSGNAYVWWLMHMYGGCLVSGNAYVWWMSGNAYASWGCTFTADTIYSNCIPITLSLYYTRCPVILHDVWLLMQVQVG